jgi:hypothetical protein
MDSSSGVLWSSSLRNRLLLAKVTVGVLSDYAAAAVMPPSGHLLSTIRAHVTVTPCLQQSVQ